MATMRYSGVQDDDHYQHALQSRAAEQLAPDSSGQHYHDVSEWGAFPEATIGGGRGAGSSMRKAPPKIAAGAARAVRSGKERSGDRGSGSLVSVPDLPSRLGAEGGAGRMEGGAGARVVVSNILYRGEEGARGGVAQHAGRGRVPVLQV